MTYNLDKIRTLLTEGFTAEELRRFCHDEPDFRPVYDQLAANTGKAEIIDRLIEYAEQKRRIELLLIWAKENNPARYEKNHLFEDIELSNSNFLDTTTQLRQIRPSRARVVILTALSVEYEAVRAYLRELQEETHQRGTVYERGIFVEDNCFWEVGLVQIGMGNQRAALETERAIDYFNPKVVLFVGIAGGIKDVKLGDVVVATKVYDYESGKVVDQMFLPRPDVGQPTYRMIERAKAEARKKDWLHRLVGFHSPLAVNVRVGAIATGEKVVASTRSEIYKLLRTSYSDTLAVEMEGRGFLQAVYANQEVDALVIRGISDLLQGKSKADATGFQEIAARHASAFAFQILAKLSPLYASSSNPRIKGLSTDKFTSVQQEVNTIELEIELPGGAMNPKSRFYIEREADKSCLEYLALPYSVTLFVQAPRQMGKSSLMQRMIYLVSKELKIKSAFINFQKFPKQYLQNEEKFLKEFCYMISEELGLPQALDKYWQRSRTNISNCGRYLLEHIIPQVESPFILAMDEVEWMLSSSFRANFFGMLRAWHEDRANDKNFKKISLFLSSSTEPYLLIDDMNQSPFNVAELISLRDFTEAEVSELNRRYHSPLNQKQVNDLTNLLSGHPYLTRKALNLLTTNRIDLNTLFAQAIEDDGPFGDVLRRYWLIILDNPIFKQALTDICHQHAYEENRVFHRLKAAGLIKRDGQKVVLRNKLYASYFERLLK